MVILKRDIGIDFALDVEVKVAAHADAGQERISQGGYVSLVCDQQQLMSLAVVIPWSQQLSCGQVL